MLRAKKPQERLPTAGTGRKAPASHRAAGRAVPPEGGERTPARPGSGAPCPAQPRAASAPSRRSPGTSGAASGASPAAPPSGTPCAAGGGTPGPVLRAGRAVRPLPRPFASPLHNPGPALRAAPRRDAASGPEGHRGAATRPPAQADPHTQPPGSSRQPRRSEAGLRALTPGHPSTAGHEQRQRRRRHGCA